MDQHDGDGAARLRVTLLGTLEVRRGDAVLPVSGARARGLLVRLALAGGRVVGPATLTGALWPEDGPADPANALQSLVSRLRRMLGAAGAVAQADGGYRLDVAEEQVDALRFERLAARGRDCLRAGDAGAAEALLGQAAGLWAEPAAVALVAPSVATRLARVALETVADLAEAELTLGRADAAAARLIALRAEHPAHERVAALLIDALAAQGRQGEALRLFEEVRETLADELGADPGTALRERHVRLLRAETRAPEPAAGPAARPAAQPANEPAGNLPTPLTSFVGRDDDLARLDTLLATGRLVTIAGPGGAGKTRLALEAARRHRHEYPDGAWLVDLASVTEPAKVGAAVLASIGQRGGALFEGRIRSDGDEPAVLVERLNGRQSLLVVDNCEHLIDAVAGLITTLLPRCAGLRVLATSREPLAIDGEALVPLGPLTLPGPGAGLDEIRRAPAVRLFADRAAAVRPGFDVDQHTAGDVLRVVHGLDGLPLALELAAARLRALSLEQLSAGLSDRFRLLGTGSRAASARHRTLRAVIAWSWDLLGDDERTVAERVSVLPGGVTAGSAAAVCHGTTVPAAAIPELLAALVDRSLLQLAPEPGRYRMLETLREYGVERLTERGTLRTARDAAASHLTALVVRNDPRLRGPEQLDALRIIHGEYDNAIAALRHLCDTGNPGAIRLGLGLTWYWQMFGRHLDATWWLGEALAVPGRTGSLTRDLAAAVRLLNTIGSQAGATLETARDHKAELRVLSERLLARPALSGMAAAVTALTLFFLDDKQPALVILDRLAAGPDIWLSGLVRLFRAQIAENEGNVDQLRTDVAGALERFAGVGDRWGMATALPMRAMLRQYDGDLDGAEADLTEARRMARQFGALNLTDEIFIDMRWIDLHMRRGQAERAYATVAAARERTRRAASWELGVIIDALEASLLARTGELDRAVELLEAADTAMDQQRLFPSDHGRALTGSIRALVCLKRGDGPGAEAALVRAYAAALESQDMPILSMVAVTAAHLADFHRRHRESARLLGAAARLRGTHDHSEPMVRELTDRGRAALGEAAFTDAYSQGWELDGKTASAQVDPARLQLGAGDQARRL